MLQTDRICTDLAKCEGTEDGGGELFRLVGFLIILFVFLVVLITCTGARCAIGELDCGAAALVRDLVAESDVGDPEVSGGSNDGGVPRADGKTPARCKVGNTVRKEHAASREGKTDQRATATAIPCAWEVNAVNGSRKPQASQAPQRVLKI